MTSNETGEATAGATGLAPARDLVLLGDEAVAQAAIDAGITAGYAYPGTPSTEILEYVLKVSAREGRPHANWSANEKTAYEAAIGVSMVGRRVLVAMKHVGLNVAMDAFVNSALVDLQGGLVCVVADDPGMHSSQNEQDTRWLADFARVPLLEPADQQEAYDMTWDAFELSERFHVPVVVRLVTRLAHSRSLVARREPRRENSASTDVDAMDWILLPVNARRLWKAHLEKLPAIEATVAAMPWNRPALPSDGADAGEAIITTGVARNYLLENLGELGRVPRHLHVGAYPLPVEAIRALVGSAPSVLILEEGQPYLERLLRGLVPPEIPIRGKLSGDLPPDGELGPDVVREALGLPARPRVHLEGLHLPARPPQLCTGCPHRDTFAAVRDALVGFEEALVTSDIGCYTLGALPPYRAIQSCVCMGASVGMAKGAADAGVRPVLGVIGDSTFLHSGVTGLMDAVAEDTPMTLLILDNETVGMTGQQDTVLPHSRIEPVVRGVGVDDAHLHLIEAHPRKTEAIAALLRRELEHEGLSVIIAYRQCIQAARRENKKKREASS